MNRNLGMSAGVLALLAVIFHLSPLGSDQANERAETRAPPKAAAAAGKAGDKDAGADELEGPWLATRAIFGEPKTTSPARAPQTVGNSTPRNGDEVIPDFGIHKDDADVEKVLTTVPDPWHTRLALFADGSLDAIEAAATRAHWVFAAQWLPWADPVDSEARSPLMRRLERRRAREQEREPGLLVFRHAVDFQKQIFDERVLLVFVVGETPTGGINRAQFRKARSYMRSLPEGKRKDPKDKGRVFILAPSFSGSFHSLKELRQEDANTGYTVRDGSASSVPDAEALQKAKVTFSSANSSSSDFRDYFWSALGALQIPPENAAILSEDETLFGTLVDNKGDRLGHVLTLKFPRDISQLRNAYRDDKSPTGDKGLPADVQFSLKDSELGEDTIPSYSGVQGPLSQDSRLEEDIDIIRRNQIRAVEIIATNALDALFLARVLQQKSPDTRIVLPYPNLLFVEAARTEGLRNVLALSSYPLFGERNWWLNQDAPLLTYQDSRSEGVCNAMSLVLADLAKARGEPGVVLVDDYWWGTQQKHPPMWLLALDREGFLPVRAWNHSDEANDMWWEKVLPGGSPPSPTSNLSVRPAPVWNLCASLVGLVGLAAVIWSAILWVGSPRWDGRFLPVIIQTDGWRLFYLFNFLLLLAAMQAILCQPWWNLRTTSAASWGLHEVSVLVLFALLILVRWFYDNPHATKQTASGWLMLISLIIYVAGWEVWRSAGSSEQDSAGFFFSLRAVELRLQSSPALPILSALFALAIFCYVHMHRIYLAACQEPRVVTNLQTVLQSRLEKSGRSLSQHFGSPFGLIELSEWLCVASATLAAAVVAFWFDPYSKLASIDGYPFNILLLILQWLLVATILHSCVQMARAWMDLKSFLASLGTLPLANFFIARSRTRSNRPIWVQNLNLQSLSALVRGPIVLHDIALHGDADIKTLYEHYRDEIRRLIADEPITRVELLDRNEMANERNVEITTKLFNEIILPHWLSTPLVGKLESSSGKEAGAEYDPIAQVSIPGDPEKIWDLSQTFVALHFTPFLIYSVRQIRNFIWFLSLGFVSLALSMNTDSPQAPQVVSRFLLALFAVIAVILWRCLAGIERDPIISRIEGTKPGELNLEFYFKLIGYGALPVLGLLASEFPSIANFLFSWIEPTLTALR
jgi:hypothetical protein